VQGDVGKLTFDDCTFDAVLSMNGFHVFPDKEKAYAEDRPCVETRWEVHWLLLYLWGA
jgi:Methylase involved in ubiquinone/menaquinone biosynthesis